MRIEKSLSIFRDIVKERFIVIPNRDENDGKKFLEALSLPLSWGIEIDSQSFRTNVDGELSFGEKAFLIDSGALLNHAYGENKRIFDSVLVELSYRLESDYRAEGANCKKCKEYSPFTKPSAAFICWECKQTWD